MMINIRLAVLQVQLPPAAAQDHYGHVKLSLLADVFNDFIHFIGSRDCDRELLP